MKSTILVLALSALASIVPANAATYLVDFTGTVYQTQGATGRSIGDLVTGHLDLESTTSSILNFSIAGQSIESGYQSSISIGPAYTDAIYTAQISPLMTGMSLNSTFSLDLSSLTNRPSTDSAFTLLTDTFQLATNLDTVGNPNSAFPSTFNYYRANSNGTNVRSLNANLTSVSATITPEPSSFALLASSLLVFGLLFRLRRA